MGHILFFTTLLVAPALFFQLTENNSKTGPFTAFIYCFIFSFLCLIGLNIVASAAVTIVFMMTVYALSKIKYHFLMETFFYNDVFVFDRLAWRDVEKVIPYARLLIVATLVMLFGFAVWVSSLFELRYLATGTAFAIVTVSSIAIWLLCNRAYLDILGWTINARHISTFFITMIQQHFRPSFEAQLDLPMIEPAVLDFTLTQAKARPHIILMLQEALWNPQAIVPDLDEGIRRYFAGADISRKLKVDVFGGGTIISLLSALTGLPSDIFGRAKAHAQRIWHGRIHVSLPLYLAQFGYTTSQYVSAESEWMRVGRFYKSIGVQHLYEPDEFTGGAFKELMHQRDSIVLGAALNGLKHSLSNSNSPTLTILETSGNHTPYGIPLYDDDQYIVAERRRLSQKYSAQLPKAAIEYLTRLCATVADYENFKDQLKQAFPDEQFVIVQFGDHQPNWLAKIAGHKYTHETALIFDCINWIAPEGLDQFQHIDICNLDLFVAKCAGLPINGYLQAKNQIVGKEGEQAVSADGEGYLSVLSALRQMKLIDESRNLLREP
jgi:hypothetical protein